MKKTASTHVIPLPTQVQIAERAQQIYLEHGAQTGHELDDWLQAEYELMQLPVHKIVELETKTPSNRAKYAVVALVQAALVFGATNLTQIRR